MKLGIISGWDARGLQQVRDYGLDYVEFCINVGTDAKTVLARAEEIKANLSANHLKVSSIGRWGTDRLAPDGSFNAPEHENDLALIDLCAAVGCPIFTCGCNPIADMPFAKNAKLAAQYFRALMDYATPKGVAIAVYNCDWNNLIYDRRGWDAVLDQAPGLGIKYDTSHCINRNGDYLMEMFEYGKHIKHFHLKGTVRVQDFNVPDPPAGMDGIAWGSVFAILYAHDYKAVASIEPHSGTWTRGARGDFGVRFTIDYMRKFILEEDTDAGKKQYMPGDTV
ncbi:MAG: sugar phosphate isomerase/epimerase [Oscillospiraceae bacterium]|jgi:sugar phosphate isomerase/epimerase|nr:sugar phosphate isomerase/epimerase [Oscillospiraceae bacterium]